MQSSYFEQPNLWQNTPDPYQIQTQADVLDLLPDDISSVLDVGCGDGFITNQLPESLFVVGLDFSAQALRGVRHAVSLGEMKELPFPDASFDLVMANDVIEHVPEADLRQSLAELRRVARNYILITVPFEEDLKAHEARCAHCGTIYHVNHHQRSFSKSRMLSLFEGLAEPLEIRLSGYIHRPPLDPTNGLRRQLNIFEHWHNAKCPVCGSGEQVHSTAGAVVEDWLDRKRAELWAQRLQSGGFWSNRTEIMALYTCVTPSVKRDIPKIAVQEQSLLRIDFRNPLQIATPDFTPGYLGAQFRLASNVIRTSDGAVGGDDPTAIPMVIARFPVNTQIHDRIEIEAISEEAGNVRLYALGYGRENYLGSLRFDAETKRAVYLFERSWRTEPLGFVLQLYPDVSVVLQSIQYVPIDGEKNVSAPFVNVQAGHNVAALETQDYLFTWGFFAADAGSLPLVPEDRDNPLNQTHQLSAEEALIDTLHALDQQEQVSLRLTDTAQQLEQTSTTLANTLRQLEQVSLDLRNTQRSISLAENPPQNVSREDGQPSEDSEL